MHENDNTGVVVEFPDGPALFFLRALVALISGSRREILYVAAPAIATLDVIHGPYWTRWVPHRIDRNGHSGTLREVFPWEPLPAP